MPQSPMLIFFDGRFISFVTLMGLLDNKNHFCTTFSGTDFTILFEKGISGEGEEVEIVTI